MKLDTSNGNVSTHCGPDDEAPGAEGTGPLAQVQRARSLAQAESAIRGPLAQGSYYHAQRTACAAETSIQGIIVAGGELGLLLLLTWLCCC